MSYKESFVSAAWARLASAAVRRRHSSPGDWKNAVKNNAKMGKSQGSSIFGAVLLRLYCTLSHVAQTY